MRGQGRNLTREARGVLEEAMELEQVMVHTSTQQDLYQWLVARLRSTLNRGGCENGKSK